MREKPGKYLNILSYLFLVFLFLFYLYSFPGIKGKEQEKPLEENYQENNSEAGDNTEKNDAQNGMENETYVVEQQLYLGVYGEQIAVFEKDPSGALILKEVLPYPVKKVYYEELRRGIPFSSEEEKLLFLENFTS